jgi:hypothetical protein
VSTAAAPEPDATHHVTAGRWFITAEKAIDPVLAVLRSDVRECGRRFPRFGGMDDAVAKLEADPRDKMEGEIQAAPRAV